MTALALAAGVVVSLGPTSSAGPTVDGLDPALRLNEVQAIGTHNSYHLQPTGELADAIRFFDPGGAEQLEYSHSPLDTQLATEHVRQVELDVFADSSGGLLAAPVGGVTLNGLDPASRPEMFQPGFKTLHIQDIDYETTCTTFVGCLTVMETWSDANPSHAPVAVLVEVKDEPIDDPLGFGFLIPEVVGPAQLDALDAEIRSVLDPGDIITPDDVRGAAPTLEQAVLTTGWPTLADSQGKFLFLMDNGGRIRDDYRAGHPSLQGRVQFVSSEPGTDDAAFVKRNDPNAADIPLLVAGGYVVRTRADSPTFEARSGSTVARDTALASGAQWVSTDYPVKNRAYNQFGSEYYAALPEGAVVRCNPVNAPDGCVTPAGEIPADARNQPPPPPPPPDPEPVVPDATDATTGPVRGRPAFTG